jgi:nucleoside-diphosphate-sugar epimerase
MKCLVTGAAGFIGSHLCERLVAVKHEVIGIDAFIPYYPRTFKEGNIEAARKNASFVFREVDLRKDNLDGHFEGVQTAFHLAAMPGLARSWSDFDLYESCNVAATQRLLEAALRSPTLERFVFASTSSVYGRYSAGDEGLPLRPISPYGVTKLAAENLCRAYAEERGLPLVVLRYFSVYGPRQRPDMGYRRFIEALLHNQPVIVYGDGMQVRGNTYISDCVEATIAALKSLPGEIYNVGGGESASVWDVLNKLQELIGRRAAVSREPARPGDQRQTFADTGKLQRQLGWKPIVSLDEGLARQIAWQQSLQRKAA